VIIQIDVNADDSIGSGGGGGYRIRDEWGEMAVENT
jgi:hypothetical protein